MISSFKTWLVVPILIEHPFVIDVMIRKYTVYIYVEPNIW